MRVARSRALMGEVSPWLVLYDMRFASPESMPSGLGSFSSKGYTLRSPDQAACHHWPNLIGTVADPVPELQLREVELEGYLSRPGPHPGGTSLWNSSRG